MISSIELLCFSKPHDVDATLFILSSATQILSNLEAKADLAKGQKYFEGSMKFMNTLTEVLDSLTDRVKVNHRSDLILACVSLFRFIKAFAAGFEPLTF